MWDTGLCENGSHLSPYETGYPAAAPAIRTRGRTQVTPTAQNTQERWPDSVHALYGGARLSDQRALIAEAVLASPVAFTAEELHEAVCRHAEGIGLATVYRALAAMQEAGTVAAVGERHGSALLARCGRGDHHHHLLCTACGAVVGVDCPLGGAALPDVTPDGHVVTRHEITLYGLCSGCRIAGAEG